jgi:hypothetical protein
MRFKPAFLLALAVATLVLFAIFELMRNESLANARRLESDFQKLIDSGTDHLYCYYPQLLERVCQDDAVSKKIQTITFTSVVPKGDYSSLAQFPNVDTIECTYVHDCEILVSAMNRTPSLKKLNLYYCSNVDKLLVELSTPTLEQLSIHAFRTDQIDVESVQAFKERMPGCFVHVNGD